MNMNSISKTLYIPLYGKSYISKNMIFFLDPKAEEIWAAEGFPLKGKSASKWLALYMGMRAVVYDDWLRAKMSENPDAVVLQLGCGMETRICRVGNEGHMWYDLDFAEVIQERKKYFAEEDTYRMLPADITAEDSLCRVVGKTAIVIMEGISMYLNRDQLTHLFRRIDERFEQVFLLMDCYTEFAAKASKYKNPINDVGVTKVYGLNDPKLLETDGIKFCQELDMTPADLIDQLQGMEMTIFKKLYAGAVARKMYRLYEYEKR